MCYRCVSDFSIWSIEQKNDKYSHADTFDGTTLLGFFLGVFSIGALGYFSAPLSIFDITVQPVLLENAYNDVAYGTRILDSRILPYLIRRPIASIGQ